MKSREQEGDSKQHARVVVVGRDMHDRGDDDDDDNDDSKREEADV